MSPDYFMECAYQEACKALEIGEVPVGAVVVLNGRIIARSFNMREKLKDPLAHAEILAIRDACRFVGDWRLTGAELYTTLEPCIMCAGAIVQARIEKVFFGAEDPKGGAVVSLYRIFDDARLNHRVYYKGGILADRCSKIIKDFFKNLRSDNI